MRICCLTVFLFSCLICLEIQPFSREFLPLSLWQTFSTTSLWSCLHSGQITLRQGLFRLSLSSVSELWPLVKPTSNIASRPCRRRARSRSSTSSGTLPPRIPTNIPRTGYSRCTCLTTMFTPWQLQTCPCPETCSLLSSCLGCLVFYLLVTSLAFSY